MKRIKFLSMSMLAVLLCGSIAFMACKKKETDADKGRKLAKEACACFDKKTDAAIESCLDALESKYNLDKYDEKSDFYKAFIGEIIFCDGFMDFDWEASNIKSPVRTK